MYLSKSDYFCVAETLKQLNKGEYFTKKEIAYPKDSQVWIKGEYNHSLKKYECTRFSDMNDIQYISGDKIIYTDFIF